jgi:signal transduction histidine kinase
MSQPRFSPPGEPPRSRARWWGAAIGVLAAVVDTFSAGWLGVSFTMGGQDATLWLCAYFSVTCATLGFLAGYVLDLRRRDRHTAAVVQEQLAAINAAQARLAQSEKLAALGQLAATVAHEVRNPLAVIRSAAQDIADQLPAADQDARRSCSFITAEIDRLTSVIGSLLALARPLRVERHPVAVGELFDRALLLARGAPHARQVPVQHRRPPGLPSLDIDADLICQVLIDLLSNAAEAVESGGEITLEAQAADGGVDIVVADSGPGIPPELRQRIFEPFFTTRPGGTGLGLAVARQIVEAHGGRINVGERPGGGAQFRLRLPSVDPQRVAA